MLKKDHGVSCMEKMETQRSASFLALTIPSLTESLKNDTVFWTHQKNDTRKIPQTPSGGQTGRQKTKGKTCQKMIGLHKTRYENRGHDICNRGRKDGYVLRSMAQHHGPDGKAE